MNKSFIILLATFLCVHVHAQQAYFVDGYHGGIYGHYPVKWKTQFIVDQLSNHPVWKLNPRHGIRYKYRHRTLIVN